jgi:hypothetical protein
MDAPATVACVGEGKNVAVFSKKCETLKELRWSGAAGLMTMQTQERTVWTEALTREFPFNHYLKPTSNLLKFAFFFPGAQN